MKLRGKKLVDDTALKMENTEKGANPAKKQDYCIL